MTNYLAFQLVFLIFKTTICVVLSALIFTPFTLWFNNSLKNGGGVRFPYDVQYFRHRFCFMPGAVENGSDITALTRLLLNIPPKFHPIGRSLIARGRCLETAARKAPWFKSYVGDQDAGGDGKKFSTDKKAPFQIPGEFWRTTDVCLCDFRFTMFLLFVMLIVIIVLNIPTMFVLTNECQTWKKTLKPWRYWCSIVEAIAWLLLGGSIGLFDLWKISDQWSVIASKKVVLAYYQVQWQYLLLGGLCSANALISAIEFLYILFLHPDEPDSIESDDGKLKNADESFCCSCCGYCFKFFQRKNDHNRLKWEQSSKSDSSSDRTKELKKQLGSARYKDDDPAQIEQYLILKQLYKHKKPEPRKRSSFP